MAGDRTVLGAPEIVDASISPRPHSRAVDAANAAVARHAHGRVPKAVRRDQLVALARQLFAERGVRHTSMDELARRAEVSKPVIYKLIGSKEQVFGLIVDQIIDELQQAVSDALLSVSEGPERIRAGARAFFTYVVEHRREWLSIIADASGDELREIERIRDAQASLVAAFVSEAVQDRYSGIDASARQELSLAVAHTINGAVEALARWSINGPDWPPDALAEVLCAILGAEQAPAT